MPPEGLCFRIDIPRLRSGMLSKGGSAAAAAPSQWTVKVDDDATVVGGWGAGPDEREAFEAFAQQLRKIFRGKVVYGDPEAVGLERASRWMRLREYAPEPEPEPVPNGLMELCHEWRESDLKGGHGHDVMHASKELLGHERLDELVLRAFFEDDFRSQRSNRAAECLRDHPESRIDAAFVARARHGRGVLIGDPRDLRRLVLGAEDALLQPSREWLAPFLPPPPPKVRAKRSVIVTIDYHQAERFCEVLPAEATFNQKREGVWVVFGFDTSSLDRRRAAGRQRIVTLAAIATSGAHPTSVQGPIAPETLELRNGVVMEDGLPAPSGGVARELHQSLARLFPEGRLPSLDAYVVRGIEDGYIRP